MRPYLAIVKDSFREALASRVLWVLLLLISAMMIALLPFHWVTTIAAELGDQDVRNTRSLCNVLKSGADENAPDLTSHVWNSLSQKTRERLTKLDNPVGPQAFQARKRITNDLNDAIGKDDFYKPELWVDVKLSKRAEELLEMAPLEGDELKQFNRLALESALPGQLRPCPDEAVMFRYAKWDMDFIPSLRRKDAIQIIDQFMISFMAFFVGFFGIFAGVLVTAPIIPNMLNSGSLHVLLSKPVARPLLFISKFLGGCSFVAINATYLIVGMWLILGMRFGIWKPQLLWSIPLFLFSFAIFYSVSALSGLVWRSAIMAIVATILFWFMCTMVGVTKGTLEQFVMVPDQISRVMSEGDELFIAKANGEMAKFDPATNDMVEIFAEVATGNRRGPEMMMGPTSSIAGMIYDGEKEQLMVLDRNWSKASIVTGTKANNWRRDKKVSAPKGARALFKHKGQPIVVADDGVFPAQADTKPTDEKQGSSIFGVFTIPAPKSKEKDAVKLSGDLGALPGDARIAYDELRGDIYVHGARKIRKLSEVDGLFQQVMENELDVPQITHVTAGGGIFATANHESDSMVLLRVFGDDLVHKKEIDTSNETDVRQLIVSKDGRFLACLFQSDELRVFDLQNDKEVSVPSKGTVASIRFADDSMLMASVSDKITTLSLPDFRRQNTVSPTLPIIKKIYNYFVNPLYVVFPKPAELQNTMQYAITGKETMKIEGPGFGPNGRTVKLNPWQPLMSNSIFIGVMLLIGSVYVYRQDF